MIIPADKRAAFSAAIALIASHLPTRHAVPAYAMIRIIGHGDALTLEGHGESSALTLRLPISAPADLNLAVRGKVLAQVLHALPAGDLHFDVNGSKLALRSGRSKFALPLPALDAIPALSQPSDASAIRVLSGELLTKFRAVSSACATGSVDRPVLSGVYLQISPDGQITTAGTDGRRLSRTGPACLAAADHAAKGIALPPATLKILTQLLPQSEELTISYSATRVLFVAPTWSLCSQLLEGSYPNVDMIIPASFRHSIPLTDAETVSVREALRLAALAAELSQAPSILVEIQDGQLQISADSEDGSCSEIVPVAGAVAGPSVRVNHEYFLEALRQDLPTTLSLNDSVSPLKLTQGEAIHIIMPMRN